MLIKNKMQLELEMKTRLNKVVDSIMLIILDKLRDVIQENVYDAYTPKGDWGNRTGQFKNSWTVSVPQIVGDWYYGKVDNQNFNFEWNKDKNLWSHGNSKEPVESNDAMNEIIDNRQGGSNFGFPALKRHYWFETLLWVDDNLERLFRQECLKYGLNIKIDYVFK